ncbi:hypothetical protein [Arthrobacter pityocampae]|uniref:hypothetical protein n=1 Tax=Arthrobacter pityocampae TaxID=547334 RepID=UPI0037367494
MTRNKDIDTLLRHMDPATEAPPARPQRARTDLEHVLSHDPSPTVRATTTAHRDGSTRPQPATPSIRRRRAVVLGGLVAATTAGLFVVPALAGGDAAFATWTASPVTLSGQDREDAVADCLASNEDVGDGMYAEDLANSEVAIAERRGAWMTVVLTGADGFESTCTTDASAPWFDKGMIGSIGRLGTDADPTPRTLKPTQLGTGMIMNEPISMAAGRAGEDITGITYTSITGEDITATVSAGYFAFWLPGDELQDASDGGSIVTVTYRDGTSETQELSF